MAANDEFNFGFALKGNLSSAAVKDKQILEPNKKIFFQSPPCNPFRVCLTSLCQKLNENLLEKVSKTTRGHK